MLEKVINENSQELIIIKWEKGKFALTVTNKLFGGVTGRANVKSILLSTREMAILMSFAIPVLTVEKSNGRL